MVALLLNSSKRLRGIGFCAILLLLIPAGGVRGQDSVRVAALRGLSLAMTVKCRIERFQSMSGIRSVGTGEFSYRPDIGFRYDFRFGGEQYRFVLNGDTLCSVNLSSRTGFKICRRDTAGFAEMYRSLHILGAYLSLADSEAAWRFRARLDQGYFFSRVDGGGERFIRIDPCSGRVDLIEDFDDQGMLVRKIRLGFSDSRSRGGTMLPSVMVLQSGSGQDSIVVSRVRIDEALPERDFELPREIAWRAVPARSADTSAAR